MTIPSASKPIEILKELVGAVDVVSFREFVSSPDFCDNEYLYEFWYKQFETLPENLSELILDGSLGGGKTTFSSYYIAYRVYCLFAKGSPQKQLGLAEDTDIFILYFSVSLVIAKLSGYQYLYDIFANCKWFNDNCPINKMLKSSIEFVGKHFRIMYASSESKQIGLNVWGFILDEANFKGQGVGTGVEEQYKEVTQLYEQLLQRQESRFARADGSLDSLAILVSSASYQSSFLEKRKLSARGDKNAKVITSIAYEVKPASFSKERFEVFIGAGVVEPCIIDSEEHKQTLLRTAGVLGTASEQDFIRSVPVNLLKSFQSNIVLALQNHCGVPTNISSSFMNNLKYLYDSYVTSDEIKPILQSFSLEASTGDDTQLIEYLIPENIQFSERPHVIFIDASIQHDTASIVCYRYDGFVKDKGDMHTKVFSLKLIPPTFPNQTKLSKIEQFVIDISSHLNLVAVGSDQYQSSEMRQNINDILGLEDIRVSIDSTDIPHLAWQRALVEGRIRQVKEDLLEKEVREAVHDWKRHRVLKSRNSSDDCLQGNCGAYFLSETVGKNSGSLDDLYESSRLNLVGSQSFKKFMVKSGYKF